MIHQETVSAPKCGFNISACVPINQHTTQLLTSLRGVEMCNFGGIQVFPPASGLYAKLGYPCTDCNSVFNTSLEKYAFTNNIL